MRRSDCRLTGEDSLWIVWPRRRHGRPPIRYLRFRARRWPALWAPSGLTPAALGTRLLYRSRSLTAYFHGLHRGRATFLAAYLVARAPLPAVFASIVAGAFIIYRHSSNIQRLRLGTEPSFEESDDYRWRKLGAALRDRTRPLSQGSGFMRRIWPGAW
jgi:hypothetical protein